MTLVLRTKRKQRDPRRPSLIEQRVLDGHMYVVEEATQLLDTAIAYNQEVGLLLDDGQVFYLVPSNYSAIAVIEE